MKQSVKSKLKKNSIIIAAGIGVVVGGYFGLFLRQKRIDFLNRRALKGMNITVFPTNHDNVVGIRLYNIDTGEGQAIGITKEAASRIADYIYQIVNNDTNEVDAIQESAKHFV